MVLIMKRSMSHSIHRRDSTWHQVRKQRLPILDISDEREEMMMCQHLF